MFSLTSVPSTTTVLSAYTTFAASAMFVRTVLNEVQNMSRQLIPKALLDKILSKIGGIIGNLSPRMTLVIDEYINGHTLNQVYESSEAYLRTKISPSISRLKLSKAPQETNFSLTVNKGEKIVDDFQGIELTWEMISVQNQKTSFDYEGLYSTENVESKSFELSFNRKDMEMVLSCYLPYVMKRGKIIKEENQVVKLYSIGSYHGDTNLNHPSTFDTLAMDPVLKKEVMDDLDRFVKRRDYYQRVGKAWKRGYLLYGPPGTGKSSLIAAMANYLKFDIYDLELSSIRNNSNFRQLLLYTANRSILVIEDIDCSVELQNRQVQTYNPSDDSQLTLSGLLNFIDGLWSSCGDERIIVFTTNHKERLDPALLRPGRMDMHIHMSYCSPSGFRILASNYLGVKNHSMFIEIEKLITEVEVTPAEIAEQLMKSEEADVSLGGLVNFLQIKKIQTPGGKEENEIDETGNEEEIKKGDEKKRGKINKKKGRMGKKQKVGF